MSTHRACCCQGCNACSTCGSYSGKEPGCPDAACFTPSRIAATITGIVHNFGTCFGCGFGFTGSSKLDGTTSMNRTVVMTQRETPTIHPGWFGRSSDPDSWCVWQGSVSVDWTASFWDATGCPASPDDSWSVGSVIVALAAYPDGGNIIWSFAAVAPRPGGSELCEYVEVTASVGSSTTATDGCLGVSDVTFGNGRGCGSQASLGSCVPLRAITLNSSVINVTFEVCP